MPDRIPEGSWVEIRRVVLEPGERAPQVPEDTRRIPFEMRVWGFLERATALGEAAVIVTSAGRRVRGTLSEARPSYDHGFGPPIAELLPIGNEARTILRRRGRVK